MAFIERFHNLLIYLPGPASGVQAGWLQAEEDGVPGESPAAREIYPGFPQQPWYWPPRPLPHPSWKCGASPHPVPQPHPPDIWLHPQEGGRLRVVASIPTQVPCDQHSNQLINCSSRTERRTTFVAVAVVHTGSVFDTRYMHNGCVKELMDVAHLNMLVSGFSLKPGH